MGDGAFSNVYKAIERKTGRKVAVKVVRKYELNSSQVSVAFQANIFFFFLLLLPCATSHTLAKCGVQGGRWDCSDNICSESTLTNTDRRSERQQTPQQGLQEEGTACYRGLFFLFLHHILMSFLSTVAGPRASGCFTCSGFRWSSSPLPHLVKLD